MMLCRPKTGHSAEVFFCQMFRYRRPRHSSPPTSLVGSIPCGSEKNQQFGQSIDWLFAQVMVSNHLKGEIFQAAETIFENQKKHPFLSNL